MFEPLTEDEMLQESMRVFGGILGVDQCLIEGYCAEVKEQGGDCFMSTMFENISDAEIAELADKMTELFGIKQEEKAGSLDAMEDVVFRLTRGEVEGLLLDAKYQLTEDEVDRVIAIFGGLWSEWIIETARKVIDYRSKHFKLIAAINIAKALSEDDS